MAFHEKWRNFLDEAEGQPFRARLLKGVPPVYKATRPNWGSEEETARRSQSQKEHIINSLYGIEGVKS